MVLEEIQLPLSERFLSTSDTHTYASLGIIELCFVVVLRHSNSISGICWQWYDVWVEKEKYQAYTIFTRSSSYRIMSRADFWSRCKLFTAGKWIAAQLNVMGVTQFVPLSPGSPTLCLNQLSPLPSPISEEYVSNKVVFNTNTVAYMCQAWYSSPSS